MRLSRKTWRWRPGRIGAYRIEREIGHGGMGAVFLASRADEQFKKDSRDQGGPAPIWRRRFFAERLRSERQILAELEHPNIARLLDGGVRRTASRSW